MNIDLGVSAPQKTGIRILVAPPGTVVDSLLSSFAGLETCTRDQRPTVSGPFGLPYRVLASLEETGSTMSNSVFSLAAGIDFSWSVACCHHEDEIGSEDRR
jgi:hypothetical protein